MSEQQAQFGDTHIAVVSFADRERLVEHRRSMLDSVADSQIAWISDPERRLYQALELSRTSLWRVYNPGTIRMYAGLLRSGRRFRKPVEDTRQLGGDVVFGTDGLVHTVFRPASPDTRPSVDQLVSAVDASREDA